MHSLIYSIIAHIYDDQFVVYKRYILVIIMSYITACKAYTVELACDVGEL